MRKIIRLNERDNVAIALVDITEGTEVIVDETVIKLRSLIPAGHKFALSYIKEGKSIVKYGMPIGNAIESIEVGDWVHVHNVKTALDNINEYEYKPYWEEISVDLKDRKIKAYKRKSGDMGIRNELWIIPTVGCVNGTAKSMVNMFKRKYTNMEIDGIHTFNHPYGCSQMGDDHETTKKVLQNMAKHPNAGGVLVLGLGCENNQIGEFKKTLGDYDKDRVRFLNSQDVEDEFEEGLNILEYLYEKMKEDKRQECNLSDLRIGLECGGSDGFSGITANPLLGRFSDYIVHHGGTTVLTEVPEMFGAESLLMNQAKDKDTFDKIVKMINGFKKYYMNHNQVIYENPSPGNKKGGITTLEDKSLGCTQKAGKSKVIDVLEYGNMLRSRGLNLLWSPGNDLVATTALGIAGCHMVLFTTGRGTPFGGFIPTVKISTNSSLAKKKSNWIDFDAGKLVEGISMDKLLTEFINVIVEIASGQETKNEINEIREIAIFKSGVTL